MAPARKKRRTTDNIVKDENLDKVSKDCKKEPAAENNEQKFWLMKSEPETRIEKGVDVKFGIEDLKKEPKQTACWDGVRNYQARNFMRDQMKVGDKAFFYHSNCKVPGIAGIMTIVKESYPDHTQFNSKDVHFDPKSQKENPKWFMVDVKYERMMKRYIGLPELKKLHSEHKSSHGPLKSVALFTRARLSVQPSTKEEYDYILTLEEVEEP
uniref:Thymocyte nuclear protein 1 n=1 Tax=Clytia hemisphaerica TaxID=252671 RepID=A0A0U4JR80_9CNID|nr:thymocyte nuclear protein [Clytia hemisphaerica]